MAAHNPGGAMFRVLVPDAHGDDRRGRIWPGSLVLFLIDDALKDEVGQPHHQCTQACIFLKQGHDVVLHAGIPVGVFFAMKRGCGPGRLPR